MLLSWTTSKGFLKFLVFIYSIYFYSIIYSFITITIHIIIIIIHTITIII